MAALSLLAMAACAVETPPASPPASPAVTLGASAGVTGTSSGKPTSPTAPATAPPTSSWSATRAVPWQSYVTNIGLARNGQGSALEPLGDNPVYLPAQRQFHCVVTTKDAPNGTRLRAIWSYRKVEGFQSNSMIDDAYTTVAGSVNVDFTLSSRADWSQGEYSVQVMIEDETLKTLFFSVRR